MVEPVPEVYDDAAPEPVVHDDVEPAPGVVQDIDIEQTINQKVEIHNTFNHEIFIEHSEIVEPQIPNLCPEHHVLVRLGRENVFVCEQNDRFFG